MSRQILVVGRPRSGTSAVAGILSKFGIPTGSMRSASEILYASSNPLGYFEDEEFKDLFASMIGTWYNPKLWLMPFNRGWQAQLETLVSSRDTTHETWFLKSPHFSLVGPFVLPFFSNPTLITTARPLKASAQSLAKMSGMEIEVATHVSVTYDLYLKDTMNSYRFQVGRAPLGIDYDLLVEDPETAVDGLIRELKLEPSEFQRRAAIAHVRSELRHF